MSKHAKSEALFQKACMYMPGGVNSPVRSFSSANTMAMFVEYAYGSHVVDVDGNDYLDYIGSWGPMILGHAHPIVTNHMQEIIEKGISYGLCAPKEVELAKLICEAYHGVERVRMVNSGTEATMSAIRVARGYTKKDKIIKFEGCYHGHSDSLLVKSGSGALTYGVPTSLGVPMDIAKNTIVCTYNAIQSVNDAIAANKNEIAAIIIEPIAGNMGIVPSTQPFLKALRELCTKENMILIFDEVISGFRVAYGGAAQYYGVTPDMACFGKIIGGGLPVGAYGGRKEIMDVVSPSGCVYQAGTLSGNPFAMHVGCTLLSYLKENKQVYEELNAKGTYLKEGIEAILTKHKLSYSVQQVGSLLTLFFTKGKIYNFQDVMKSDTEAFVAYFQKLYDQNIVIAPSPYEAMFISMAHTKKELDRTLVCIEKALSHGD